MGKTTKEIRKTFFEDEFNKDMKKSLPEVRKKYKELIERLDKDTSKNFDVSKGLLKQLRNEGIIEIITEEYVENEAISAYKKKIEELKEKVKEEKGKRKEVMMLHIDWLSSSAPYGLSREIVHKLVNYLKEKDLFALQLLIYKKIKLD